MNLPSPRRPTKAPSRMTARPRTNTTGRPRPPRGPRTACSRWCGGARRRGSSGAPLDRRGRGPRRDRPRSRPCHGGRTGGRRRGEQVDHPLEGDPAAGDALAVDDGQQRLDAGRPVADLVERDAARGLGLLDREPVGDVVGGDEVERAVGEAGPQRVAIGRAAERRRDDEAGARGRIRVVVAVVGQGEVVRAGLGGDADAGRLRAADLLERRRRREVDDMDRRAGHPGERERPRRRDRLDVAWSRSSVVAR